MYAVLLSSLLVAALATPVPKPNSNKINDDVSIYFDQDADSRIVGGDVAPEGSAPYMVALTTGMLVRGLVCGGSIVSETHVLTAAHCIEPVFIAGQGLSHQLRGTVGTNLFNRGGEMYSFSRNISHEHYVRATIKNDIGFLITTQPIRFSPRIYPVALSFDHIAGDEPARVAGWGRIGAGGPISQSLLELYVTTLEGQQCIDLLQKYREEQGISGPNLIPVEPHIEICTFHSRGRGICSGDSGSALIHAETREQIGVVSWAALCARGAPDMFARVSAYSQWLLMHMHSS